ncbi:response regulator [Paenibacillus sp. TAB 01]|uniref:response regulator transcription factor n=1 Tax=Paenibacillus sp. TAB 01 TaxID=3368988 RepID=UPI00374FEB93
MLKVLLVDDEWIARQYLHHLIHWEQHGFRVCGEAGSGLEAVQLIEREAPHIVIADISMAGMDGVELSRYMSKNPSDRMKLIMLSSYDNYEYVRETMKNGAVDYLLKHRLDSAGLLELLEKVKREILEKEERPSNLNYIEKHWPALNQEVARTYFKELLLGMEGNFPRIEEYFRHLSPIGIRNLVVTAIHTVEKHDRTEEQTALDSNKRMRSILDMIQQGLSQTDNGIAAELDYGKFAVLAAFPEGRSENDIHQRLHTCLQRISSSLEMYLNLRVSFASGSICHKFSQIPLSYSSALRELANEVPAMDGHTENKDVFTLTVRQEKDLVTAIEQSDRIGLDALLDDILESFRSRRAPSSSAAYLVNELIQLADKVWRKSGNKDEDYYAGDFPGRQELKAPDQLERTARWIKQLFRQLTERLNADANNSRYTSYVQYTIQYVDSHYSENISLDMAAEHAGITASYLGRLFKQEAGMYFTEYLNRVRIDHAKRLIGSGKYKVNQINERVGFASYNYFFKVFKDLVGMTPHQYAKSKE